ncbi:hypothetical protein [uncultured Campylobacter sp.]|uniref:hypothetical protein n=1 Tax=uncultured Campylobacter sp. TaxID=218934 RepID=UPI0026195AC0|nr:hypothetical protein [uncultured Campylobacter sp.]
MQDIVSQARKEGMISTGIDLFLTALPVVLMAIDFVFEGIPGYPYNIVIIGGIFIAFICLSVIYRLRALSKISALSGIKAAALYRNCIIVFICLAVLSLFYPLSSCREEMAKETIGETIRNLVIPAAAIYIIVAWLRINFSLARVSGVSAFRIYVWLCVGFLALNILCGAGPFGLANSKPQTDDAVMALVITSFKEFLPFVALIITGIVHLLAWSKIEKINAEV